MQLEAPFRTQCRVKGSERLTHGNRTQKLVPDIMVIRTIVVGVNILNNGLAKERHQSIIRRNACGCGHRHKGKGANGRKRNPKQETTPKDEKPERKRKARQTKQGKEPKERRDKERKAANFVETTAKMSNRCTNRTKMFSGQ